MMMVQPQQSTAEGHTPGMPQATMSRPQVGIERLPTRRLSNEPRESMNCKSCRKRKVRRIGVPGYHQPVQVYILHGTTGLTWTSAIQIKCNRLRPSCEACQVFQCPCIYDAVPKKRGPKTDVLEALLKRVDGLEQKLKEKKAAESATNPSGKSQGPLRDDTPPKAEGPGTSSTDAECSTTQPKTENSRSDPGYDDESAVYSPSAAVSEPPAPEVQTDALLDTYFNRFHGKPYHILDESTLRQRLQLGQVPAYLIHAVCAVGARYTPHPSGYQSAVNLSEDFASRARGEIDTDDPSVDALQALLLLVTAFTAAGKGKKAYMLLTTAVGMAMALELHREIDSNVRITPLEREMRRRLFWTCYLLDRFMACGSKRPSLISDKTIVLRLPSWLSSPSLLPVEGELFQSDSNLQYLQGSGKKSQGSSGMLIDISRILGTTNRYLAAGGVKGDSHFPWHALSNLSKIRQDLDIWASGTEDVFSSLDSLFGQPDSTALVLSKLVYHLIHCLVYRPFLPIDLAELAGTGQHQSWQIEATNMCFLHANAIAELVELGKQTGTIEWPAFVGYCICTAGTVHIHGAHYSKPGMGEMSVFSSSAEFLSREMQQLSELRYAWASVQHQRETLQSIYSTHSDLVKSLANNPMRYSPMFHLEDFFDRYSNMDGSGSSTFSFDAANLNLSDVIVDFTADTYTGHDLYAPRMSISGQKTSEHDRPNLKRKNTSSSGRKRPELRNPMSLSHGLHPPPTPGLQTSRSMGSFSSSGPPHPSPGMLHNPTSLPPLTHHDIHDPNHIHSLQESLDEATASNAAAVVAAAAGFSLAPIPRSNNTNHSMNTMPSSGFSPPYSFAQLHPPDGARNPQSPYDPMFGTLPTNAFSSPAPWQGEDGANTRQPHAEAANHGDGTSPHGGSTGTGPGEEKDPFLSLLEQLAESESFQAQGDELDFFLSGAPGPA
ncbi:hypothetical protein DL546_007236 [Coniochaeta pulveracea]|uniref:Xylanolytic transcriptional activator regulatory domain-containing protein n=1 Tax=Coniochaeta pulveracea TaxID=177199 RepID=A0A420YNF9_9PEZI|nr:hypothetical protein DL546_007236 [Coniochaeta pulveracea]